MDTTILIHVLQLSLPVLTDLDAKLRNEYKDHIRLIGLGLLQLLSTIDDIIKANQEIITILAAAPIEENLDRATILPEKFHITGHIDRIKKNFQSICEIYVLHLKAIKSEVPIQDGAIEFIVGDEAEIIKGKPIRALSWKPLEGKIPFCYFGKAAESALRMSLKSMSINKNVGYLTLVSPIQVRTRSVRVYYDWETEILEMEQYDLTKGSELRVLLKRLATQVQILDDQRSLLAQFILNDFTLADMVS
jgi:hypothetical protein